ncbi:MAG: FAD-linked oxidase C-terminal domain-containing protein [Anaerolineae bacterium]|nr:FAD-linked oxidase C-terminal domain-containing protein [Anaerolineae bacterium]
MNQRILREIENIVGEGNVLADDIDLLLYSYDASFPESKPDVVVFPRSVEEISRIMALASAEQIPVIPRGAGTGLSGGAVPVKGGMILSLTRMTRILKIDTENLVVEVEPGVVNSHLQIALAPYGLFYPPDPASMKVCTLGGNVAENAGGPRCLKYGVTKDYVLGLEVVLPDGEIIHTGGQVIKNTSGYDLTRLFVGSEGTLGVITKIILRVLPLPEAKKTMLAIFDSLDAASKTVSAIVAAGIIPTTLELMDNLLIRCAEEFTHVGLPTDAEALLLIEVDGAKEALPPQVQAIENICRREGVREIRIAASAAEVDRLWLARRTVIGAVARVRPSLVLQDVTVPRSLLPEMVSRVVEVSRKVGLPIGVLAHAGDGNLHPLILFDSRIPGELEKVHQAEEEIFASAIELGGTLTGEHGIGLTKREYFSWQFSPKEMEVTRNIKKAFDPMNILNPGKILPE